jgi:hypothetical protein
MYCPTLAEDAAACASRRSACAVAASLYWGKANGDSGAPGLVRGLVATHAANGRLELGAKALAIEAGELGLVLRVGVHPLREQRNVDLGLPIRHVRSACRLDASGDRCALGPRLLAVPTRRLVGRPSGRHCGDRKQHGRREL